MRFGIFYEHQLPRPWEPDSEHRLLQDALEQIELADKSGIDYVWEVEHHFLEEYSHSSAPEVFLAAASQRTSRIRLGHGIVQAPALVNHPARIAERIATLDLISNGRVEFGTGEASSASELGGFGVPRNAKRAMWEESLDAVTRMLVEEPFAGYDGTYLRMPPRNVVPKPLQRPHPPLWVACSRRETIHLAGRSGIGALSFSFAEPEEAARWVSEYYRLIESEECVPRGFAHGRGDSHRARHRRRPLLWLLPWPFLRHPAPGRRYRPVGKLQLGPGRAWLRAGDRRADGCPARRPAARGRARLAARRGRDARSGQRPDREIRAGRSRSGHVRHAGGQERSRAHLRVDRAVRQGGAAQVRRGQAGEGGCQVRAARRRGRARAGQARRAEDTGRAVPDR